MAGHLERPVDPRGRAEVGRADAGRHDDHVSILVDAGFADELLELGLVRQHERHAVARDAPAGLVVVAVHRARDVRLGVSLGAAAVDRRADVEHDHRRIALVLLQPLRRNQRRSRLGRCRHCGDRGEDASTTAAKPPDKRTTFDMELLWGGRNNPGKGLALEIEYFTL